MHKFGSNLAQIIPPQNYLSIIGPLYFLLLKVYNNLGYLLFIFESIPALKKIMVLYISKLQKNATDLQ